jgi:hypothetical protein
MSNGANVEHPLASTHALARFRLRQPCSRDGGIASRYAVQEGNTRQNTAVVNQVLRPQVDDNLLRCKMDMAAVLSSFIDIASRSWHFELTRTLGFIDTGANCRLRDSSPGIVREYTSSRSTVRG